MAENNIGFYEGDNSFISSLPINSGNLLIDTEKGQMFVDEDNERKKVSDLEALNNLTTEVNTLDTNLSNDLSDAYDNTSAYAIGDVVIYESKLYRCSTAIVITEEWDSTHWTQITVETLIKENTDAITETNTNLSNKINTVETLIKENTDAITETNNNLSQKFAVVQGTLGTSVGNLPIINYPNGFTQDNTVVQGVQYFAYDGVGSNGWSNNQYAGANVITTMLNASNIQPYQCLSNTVVNSHSFKIALMRTDI